MCGLIGLVQAFDPEASLELGPVEAAQAALAGWSLESDPRGEALVALARSLHEPSYRLVGWGGFRRLRAQPALRERVSEVARGLSAAAEAIDASLAAAAETSEATEALASAAIAARDVAWRLEQDALRNVAALASLWPEDEAAPGPKASFELWRLNLILNQLERLEVRGRDSGGLATLLWVSPEVLAGLPAELQQELEQRLAIDCLRDRAILRCQQEGREVLAFAHKVAKEVGELGANVNELREKVHADRLYRALLAQPGVEVAALAHTRWASNGIINEPNCHPVANDLADAAPLERLVLGVLNGDVDNFPTLSRGIPIPSACTTDAKIIPLEVAKRRAAGASVPEAFRQAAEVFEGSTAIACLASEAPGEVQVALRGSGQAVYLGRSLEGGLIFASELYGVVELAPEFHKLNGEGGEVVRLWLEAGQPRLACSD